MCNHNLPLTADTNATRNPRSAYMQTHRNPHPYPILLGLQLSDLRLIGGGGLGGMVIANLAKRGLSHCFDSRRSQRFHAPSNCQYAN